MALPLENEDLAVLIDAVTEYAEVTLPGLARKVPLVNLDETLSRLYRLRGQLKAAFRAAQAPAAGRPAGNGADAPA